MTFLQIECFLSVVKNGSFTLASDEIALSQSSLSKHIHKLEDELGVRLLDRNTRSVALTKGGEEFIKHARAIQEEYEGMLYDLQAYSNRKRILIGSIEHMSKVGLTTPIASFLDSHPSVDIRIRQGDTVLLMDMLMGSKIEVAFIAHIINPFTNVSNVSRYSMEYYSLFTLLYDEYYLIVNRSHRLAGQEVVHWDDLAREKLVLLGSKYSLNAVVTDVFRHLGISPHIVFESDEVDTILGLMKENYGVTLLSKKIVEGNRDLIALKMRDPITRNTALVVPKNWDLAALRRDFVRHILSHYGGHAG